MTKNKNKYVELERAYNKGIFIKIFRKSLEPYPLRGKVVFLSANYTLIEILDEYLTINGWSLIRTTDISDIEFCRSSKFYEAVLKKRKISSKKIHISSDELSNFIDYASTKFKLLTFHQEKISPDTCKIGKVITQNSSVVNILEVSPDGILKKSRSAIKKNHVTRMDFGGRYEEALSFFI